jgi:hypothetical protein
MAKRPILDRTRLVRAAREPTGRLALADANTGERLTLHEHYSESGWVQLLLHAEGLLEGEVTDATFLFTPASDRARY